MHIMVATCRTLKRDRIVRSSLAVGNAASFCSELCFRVAAAFCLLSCFMPVSDTCSANLHNRALTLTNTHFSGTSSTLLSTAYAYFLGFIVSLLLLMSSESKG